MVKGRFVGTDTGIKTHRLAQAIDRAATGPDLRLPRVAGRRERDGQMLPFRQVATPDVPPVFRATAITERMQLVEEVIKTLVENGTVRIVDPLRWSDDVKDRSGGISLSARRGGLDRSRRPGQRIVHGFCRQVKRLQEKGDRAQ